MRRGARAAAGADFVLVHRRQPGLHGRPRRSSWPGAWTGADIRWFEEPCRWHNDRRGLRDVRYRGGIPVCAGQSELSVERLPRPDGGRRDRRLQLRRLVVGRPDRLAARGRGRAQPTTSRWATTRSRRSRPTCWRAMPHGTYAECFHPDRDPFWWSARRPTGLSSRTANSSCLRPRPWLGTRLGLHRASHRLDG